MNNGVVIIGGGISGLAAGYFLGKKTATIYESNNNYGGLCDNFSINGFRFDYAVHLSFTSSQIVRDIFDKIPQYYYNPNPYNYYNRIWIKHPVQNNLYALPVEERILAIESFVNRPAIEANVETYDKWLFQQYGEYIADKFHKSYTRKYWCDDAENLRVEWIGNRLYQPSLVEVLRGAMANDTANAYYAKEMRYPKFGGYKSFIEPLANNADIKLNKKAILIDSVKKYVEFADGSKVYYEKLINSIPLPELISIMKDVPLSVREAANKLVSTSVCLVSVGIRKPSVLPYLWFYIYDEDILAARVFSPSNKSPENAPQGCSSLQFEIYHSKGKELKINNEKIAENAINFLINKAVCCTADEILFTDIRNVEYANVVFNQDYMRSRYLVHEYLSKHGIYCIGRFGEWDYLWSDQSLISGKNAAEKILKEL